MAYWLVKSEPSVWSWHQQMVAGSKGTYWNGVRNYTARNNLMAMKLGEEAFFYHSNEGKEIVGIVKVIKTYYPDPSDEKGRFGMVDFAAVKAFPHPVTLETIKNEPRLADMALVQQSRLSVQPVLPEEWSIILERGGV